MRRRVLFRGFLVASALCSVVACQSTPSRQSAPGDGAAPALSIDNQADSIATSDVTSVLVRNIDSILSNTNGQWALNEVDCQRDFVMLYSYGPNISAQRYQHGEPLGELTIMDFSRSYSNITRMVDIIEREVTAEFQKESTDPVSGESRYTYHRGGEVVVRVRSGNDLTLQVGGRSIHVSDECFRASGARMCVTQQYLEMAMPNSPNIRLVRCD